MKKALIVIGLLTVTQWVFIGLLHLFLTVQDKRTPETLLKLHDTPIIGGYFPGDRPPPKEEPERRYAESIKLRLIEAQKYYELPKAFDEEELLGLVEEVRQKRDALDAEKRRLAERAAEIEQILEEIARRERTVNESQTKVDELARRLETQQREMKLQLASLQEERDEILQENLKKMAKWLDNVRPEKVAEVLLVASPGETPEERDKRYLDAARVLSLMNDEQVAKVIEALDPVDWVRIEEKKKFLRSGK